MVSGGYVLTYMDEFVDQLLTEERVCDIMLPRISKRTVLEDTEGLAPRVNALMEAMEGIERRAERRDSRSRSGSQSTSRSHSRSRSRNVSPSSSSGRNRTPVSDVEGEERYVSRSPSRSSSSYRSRSKSITPDRMDFGEEEFEAGLEAGLLAGIGGAINVDTEAIPGDV